MGVFCPKCDPNAGPDTAPMQYTTRMHLQRSRATTAFSVSNATILPFADESKPTDYPVPLSWFFTAFTGPLDQSNLFAQMQNVNNGATSSVTSQLILSLAADFAFSSVGPLDGFHQVRNLMAAAIASAAISQDNVANSGPQAVSRMVYSVRIA